MCASSRASRHGWDSLSLSFFPFLSISSYSKPLGLSLTLALPRPTHTTSYSSSSPLRHRLQEPLGDVSELGLLILSLVNTVTKMSTPVSRQL